MTPNHKPWFAVSAPGCTNLSCCACGKEIDLKFPSLDHHASLCPDCGVECLFISLKDVLLQVIPGQAPPELARIICWAQENLDEYEWLTVLSSIAQIAQAVSPALTLAPN